MIKYKEWTLRFVDTQWRNTSLTNEEGKTVVENVLVSIFNNINNIAGWPNISFSTKPISLLRKKEEYTYVTYFESPDICGDGYFEDMFDRHIHRPLIGAKLFA